MAILFWILILLGAPLLFGATVGLLLTVLLGSVIGEPAKKIPEWVFNVVEGIGAGFAMMMICRWLSHPPNIWVLWTVMGVGAFWFAARGETRQVLPTCSGITAVYAISPLIWSN